MQAQPTGATTPPPHGKATIPRYAAALDFEALWREFPPADIYFDDAYRRSADQIRQIQNERFLRQMQRAWQVPFYKRHWGAAGMAPGDIRSLDDLERIPPFSVHDLRGSLEQEPFWADYIGIDPLNRRARAADRTDQRRHHRPAAADVVHPARPRSDEHPDRATALHAGRTAVRSGPGFAVDGTDQWRRARARGDLEIYRRRTGDDRLRRADADAAAARIAAGLEGEIPDRLSGLSAAHGAGGARRTRHRSAAASASRR